MSNTTAARIKSIRRELDWQYQQGAVNERLVATLRVEMTDLPHRHRLSAEGVCRDCTYGTDWMFMSLDDILAEVDETEQVIASLFTKGA